MITENTQTPPIHTITNPHDLPGGGLYRMIQLKSPDEARQYGTEAWLLESRIIVAFYLFIPVREQS
jgi:hypothetical protein